MRDGLREREGIIWRDFSLNITDDIWTDTEGHFFRWHSTKKTMYLWIGWKNNNNQGYTYIYIILLRIVSIFDLHLLIFTYLVFWRILYLTKTESLPTAGFNFGFNLLIFTFGSIPLTDLFPHFLTFTPVAD